jgi:hypothetical protein
MFLDKLLNKIPFFRNRKIARMKKELDVIRAGFKEGYFEDKYIVSLHNIVKSPLNEFSDDLVNKTINKISLYTKSSVSALKLVKDTPLTKRQLEKSTIITLSQSTGYFSSWYSNEESVNDFISQMGIYLAVQVKMIEEPSDQFKGILEASINKAITDYSLDIDLYETLLYRFLLEDLVSIVSFYLETKYD